VHNDEGTVQYDQIQVEYCHIVSPITGRVGLRLVDPGNVVQANAGTVLAVVTQIQPITRSSAWRRTTWARSSRN
jgi:multidrug efflux system membrane fusion protein